MSDPDRSGRIEYPREGFTLHWDEHGLRVEVTDYHAGALKIPWNAVFTMAKSAGKDVERGCDTSEE